MQNPFNLPANNANHSEGKHTYDPAEVVDVDIPLDIDCIRMEFGSQFRLATGSMDSEKIDASVSEDITGKEIDAGGSGEESCSKQSNANRIETLHPITGAQQGESFYIIFLFEWFASCNFLQGSSSISAPATTNEELLVPFAIHGDTNAIPENDALSTVSKTAGEAMSLHSTISEGDYKILSQVNESPEDDGNMPG